MSSSRMTEKIHVLHSEIGAAEAIHNDLDEFIGRIEPTVAARPRENCCR